MLNIGDVVKVDMAEDEMGSRRFTQGEVGTIINILELYSVKVYQLDFNNLSDSFIANQLQGGTPVYREFELIFLEEAEEEFECPCSGCDMEVDCEDCEFDDCDECKLKEECDISMGIIYEDEDECNDYYGEGDDRCIDCDNVDCSHLAIIQGTHAFKVGDIVRIIDPMENDPKDTVRIVEIVEEHYGTTYKLEGYEYFSYDPEELEFIRERITETCEDIVPHRDTLLYVKTIFNEPAVIVIIEVYGQKFKGVAKCCPDDKFDTDKGFLIAHHRATMKLFEYELEEAIK